jgi:segregation and condensation protein A
MGYHIKLDLFEGPLDLLLHLISKAKIRIEDVSITEITEQYLDYLDQMKQFDVDIASEFLLMAANLLYIKSRALLPKPNPKVDEEPDPEQDLIRRLAEYKKYKEASIRLKERESIYSNIFYKLPEEMIDKNAEPLPTIVEGTPRDLFLAYVKALQKRSSKRVEGRVYPIRKKVLSIEEKIIELQGILHITPQCSFSDLIHDQHQRADKIITFLALLEMLKKNLIYISQEGQFADIIIRRVIEKNG